MYMLKKNVQTLVNHTILAI